MKFIRMTVNYVFTVALCLVAASQAVAQERLQLLDAIRQTLQNHPQVHIYRIREDALAGELQTAKLRPGISVTGELENVIGTGDLNWFQGSELTLALSQVVEFGEKQAARTSIVNRRQDMLQAEQRILELELLSTVTAQFIELAAVEQQQRLLARRTALANATLEQVDARVAAGRGPEAERARAAAALALAELAEQSANFARNAARISLASHWGELQPGFDAVDANLLDVQQLEPVQSLLLRLDQNPSIQLFASEARLREAEIREVRSRSATDIEAMVGVRHLAELNDTAFLLQLKAPLGNKQRTRGALTTAQANLLRVDAERELALLRMSVQLLRLDQQRQAALAEMNALQSQVIPQLNLALEATRAAFDSGRYSYLELSAAQDALLGAEEALIEAATRAHLLRVEIERLSGEPLGVLTEGVAQ